MEGDDPRLLQVEADSQGSQDPAWVVVLRSSSSILLVCDFRSKRVMIQKTRDLRVIFVIMVPCDF